MAELIRAAGGLVWRETAGELKILLVHRARYDDWSLPKGKLKPGERWEAAAVREVMEESGERVQLGAFAGVTFYQVEGRPKVVLFWNMALSQGGSGFMEISDTPEEVDRLVWLAPEAARKRLSYPDEGALVVQEAGRLRER